VVGGQWPERQLSALGSRLSAESEQCGRVRPQDCPCGYPKTPNASGRRRLRRFPILHRFFLAESREPRAESCLSGRLLLVACCLLLGTNAFGLDRNAFTFTAYDLHALVVPAEQGIEVQGRITLRNDSTAGQRFAALQISSTLVWQSIKLAGKQLAYLSEPYTSDIDHSGQVTEAVLTLPREIAPGNTVQLEVSYSGTIPADSTRLTRIGTPAEVAAQSDWDQISETFTGVRGVGYVCWYPVAMDAVSLSEGTVMFETLGAWKQRQAASTMHLQLVVPSDQPVVTNGNLIAQKATEGAEGALHERDYQFAPMGLFPPTFTIGDYKVLSRPAVNVFYLVSHQAPAQEYVLAEEKLLPFITDWFGARQAKVVVVDLPEGFAPFDSGIVFFAPLAGQGKGGIELAAAHQLTHACFRSPRPWIEEGLAHFAQALVRERQGGRKAALQYMQQFRPALAATEEQARTAPANAAAAPQGQPLTRTGDDIYYRVKAMFVWWMLRDMIGDDALQQAVHSYRAADDKEPSYLQRLVESRAQRPLEWFFDDWVYRDRGLPDFHISSASARQLLTGNVSVSVTVQNSGGAAAETPVIVPLEKGEAVQRLFVPARGTASTRIASPKAPTQVMVNDGSVPESDVNNNVFKFGN